MSQAAGPQFGIMTAPSQVTYPDILRVRKEADSIPPGNAARWVADELISKF